MAELVVPGGWSGGRRPALLALVDYAHKPGAVARCWTPCAIRLASRSTTAAG